MVVTEIKKNKKIEKRLGHCTLLSFSNVDHSQ